FERVVFFTGAGISVESGIPTYRGSGGVWAAYDYRQYACEEAFLRDPDKVWEFHEVRRQKVGACEPNRGHRAIAAFQERRPSTRVVTQNIDGLHARAGATDVIELHGSLWRLRCPRCGSVEPSTAVPLPSRKHACGAWYRPDIVWFGDALSRATVDAALAAISACDALVAVGTSAVVYPAAELPLVARRRGASLIEVNPEETPLSDAYDVHLRGKAGDVLPELVASVVGAT
ncbi:MAG: NAD-dependent deacylase, partial [Polyangiaceae bacterium]|nr:NAD-dependent deacylase [Polyangiaceae bacterium]